MVFKRNYCISVKAYWGFPDDTEGKESACSAAGEDYGEALGLQGDQTS